MYLVDNPVLQRELIGNLRMPRAFLLLFLYQALLGLVVYVAWPRPRPEEKAAAETSVAVSGLEGIDAEVRTGARVKLDLTKSPKEARDLVNIFFLAQFILASMMTPSFAAGSITGEKERKTYEMLLASPLRPSAIVFGKMMASLAYLAAIIFASLPIVMLCLPLGGVSLYEVLAAYLGLIMSVMTFGMISIACSSYFHRTLAALVVSYLVILPLAMLGSLMWYLLGDFGQLRLLLTVALLPVASVAICIPLFVNTCRRLLEPPDVGSEGKEVVDLEQEAKEAVGLVIQPHQFPDKLFAPAKRETLMNDGANPVYDKEIRSEIFSQGTLMLRVVIQVSFVLMMPLMAWCLYFSPNMAAWYIIYVATFNMLVGPVFLAGSITSERERQTLDLLLTTTITPWQILWGKLVAGMRISSVLTLFLLFPLFITSVIVPKFWPNLSVVAGYVVVILLMCVTTSVIAMFCSVLFRRTTTSLIAAYLAMSVLFVLPVMVEFFASTFFPNEHDEETTQYVVMLDQQNTSPPEIARRLNELNVSTGRKPNRWNGMMVEHLVERASINRWATRIGMTSPFATAHSLPLEIKLGEQEETTSRESQIPAMEMLSLAGFAVERWAIFAGYVVVSLLLNALLVGSMVWMFKTRWRVA